ncbi:hypothetical protein [Pseudoxanthomonas sp. 3HH-4]|nr:hypothetical protein [Pseudoxanthomonas sp. 3HH-4]
MRRNAFATLRASPVASLPVCQVLPRVRSRIGLASGPGGIVHDYLAK